MAGDLRVPAEVLAESDDAELAWRVIAPSYEAVNIYDGPEALAATIAPLTPGQRALLALHWCVAEVSNGGFHQFFTNPTGVLEAEALDGFRRIGAGEAADLLAAASAILEDAPPPGEPEDPEYDEDEAAVALDALRERLAPLEERFDELVDEQLYPQAAAYVRAHPDEFVR